jgi:hypothetical protein
VPLLLDTDLTTTIPEIAFSPIIFMAAMNIIVCVRRRFWGLAV